MDARAWSCDGPCALLMPDAVGLPLGAALWLLLVVVCGVSMLAAPASKHMENVASANMVMVSAVSSEELRGGCAMGPRTVAPVAVTVAAATPIVRSVATHPAAHYAKSMRVRFVQLSASKETQTTRTACKSAPASVAIAVNEARGVCATSTPAIEILPMHAVQREEADARKTCTGPRRMHLTSTWWIVLLLLVVLLLGQATSVTATSGADLHALNKEWYIVLVSIPVFDRVMPLKNLAEELLHRGYRVGFALPENCRHWVSDLDQLEFISLGNIVGKGRGTYESLEDLHAMGVYDSYAATLRYYASFQRPMLGALKEDFEDDRPDVVVVDRYTFAGFDVSHALHLPYVVNSPSLLLDIDSPPAYIPAPFSNFSMLTPSVLERCLNSFYRLRFRLAMVQVLKEVNHVRREHGLHVIDGKEDLFGQELVLVNSMFGLDDARPIAPQFQMIGMLEPVRGHVGKLPRDLERWLAADRTGKQLIFVSFQSDVPLSPDVVTVLMNGLEGIGARLVWRITLQEQAAFDLRSRARYSVFFVSDHVSEACVLEHAPISLMITAGNYHSVQHALSLGIPMLGIPFSADQYETMNAVVRSGAGLLMQASTFSELRVRDAAHLLLTKPQYSAAALYIGEVLKTGGGTTRAADYVASVAEFGASHLLPAKNLQPLYKTYLVDVYLVYGVLLCGAAVILRTCFSVLYSIFQIAPDVHLGVTLDGPEGPEGHHELHNNHPQHHHKDKDL